jgi:hypothetical protein
VSAAPSDALLRFYRHEGPDAQGRMLRDIWSWHDAQLEGVHDYIQWLFPLPEPSAYNPSAPLLTPADIAAFHADARLQLALKASLQRMLAFYRLVVSGAPIRIDPSPAFASDIPHWIRPGDHNHLRLTRIIGSLRLLGLSAHARALYVCLAAIARDHPQAISATTVSYWRSASERRL